MSDPPDDAVDVHTWFGLSYTSHLVLNRTLLQSMPDEWQRRFTTLMDEMDEALDPPAVRYMVRAVDDRGRFVRDPIPHYNRGRTVWRTGQQEAGS